MIRIVVFTLIIIDQAMEPKSLDIFDNYRVINN
jgi:hypothetical protein